MRRLPRWRSGCCRRAPVSQSWHCTLSHVCVPSGDAHATNGPPPTPLQTSGFRNEPAAVRAVMVVVSPVCGLPLPSCAFCISRVSLSSNTSLLTVSPGDTHTVPLQLWGALPVPSETCAPFPLVTAAGIPSSHPHQPSHWLPFLTSCRLQIETWDLRGVSVLHVPVLPDPPSFSRANRKRTMWWRN